MLAFGLGAAACTAGGFYAKWMYDRAKEREKPIASPTRPVQATTPAEVASLRVSATISPPKRFPSGLIASDVTIRNESRRSIYNVTGVDISYSDQVLKMHGSGFTFQNMKPRIVHVGFSPFWGELRSGASRTFRMGWLETEFVDACLGIVYELDDGGEIITQPLLFEVSLKDATGEFTSFRQMSEWERLDRKGYAEAYEKSVPDWKRQMDVRPGVQNK